MRQEKSDISLLLIILVLFSASIGLLHGFKFTMLSASSDETHISLSRQDILDILFMQLRSDNMEKAAEALQQFDQSAQSQVLQSILSDPALSDEQKIVFLAASAATIDDASRKAELFDALYTQFASMPVFALIVDRYPQLIKLIQRWSAKDQKDAFDTWKNGSIAYVLQHDNVPLLTKLYANGIRLTPTEASVVLDRVVTERRDAGFVPLLVRTFGADVSYSPDGKRTLLIQAVDTNNPEMVRALRDEGASPRLVLDQAVGSAISVAHDNGFHEIEIILEEH